ncbi:MAG: HAMP domain-containing histidine kinase [Candidatus Latescibacteria bacterium]|nr:HAMP domain-containing histidine kinase [Candidatus Latescibacterota bacterium]
MTTTSISPAARFSPALERVMRQVLAMRQAGDIEHLVERVWEVLREFDFQFVSCALMLMDEGRDWMTSYNIWDERFVDPFDAQHHAQPLGEGLRMYTAQASLSNAPSRYQSAVAAWRKGTVEQHTLTPAEIRELVRLNAERYGSKLTAESYPIRFYLHVPFSHGAFTLRTADPAPGQFSGEQVEFLKRLVEIFSVGYARYRDFLQVEQDRAVQKVRAEVFRMAQSSQITRIVQVIWEELEGLGYEFFRCSLSTIDREKDLYSGYYVTTQPTLAAAASTAFWSRIGQLYIGFGETPLYEGGPFRRPLIEAWQQGEVYRHLLVGAQEKMEMAAFQQRIWGEQQDREKNALDQFCLYVPFAHGMLGVASENLDPGQFREEDIALFRRLGEVFDEGYKRFLELRQREIHQGVERLRAEVASMRRSSDIVEVVVFLARQLRDLGMEFAASAISLIDEEAGLVRLYSAGPAEKFRLMPQAGTRAADRSLIDRLAEEPRGPIWIRDIAPGFDFACTVEPLAGSPALEERGRPPRIVRRTEEEAQRMLERYRQRWTPLWTVEHIARTVIRVPFSHGSVAVTAMEPGQYNQKDVDLVASFADALSLGFTRFLDFQRLEQQNRALEAASRVKSEFLANMSHELRTPMNSIINFSSLILEGVYGDIPDDLRDAVEEIDRNSENLLALINDILDLSKIEAGAMSLQLSACAPEGFVETAIATMERKATDKGLELISEVQGELPVVRADERRITLHVLINLVKNAIKFTREGQVRVGVRKEGDEVLFWVADTGIGIPEEERERIFETFHQVDSSITREAEGTGLGLAIARKFVEMHGGRIWAESEPGQGSTFWFTLPVKS